MTYTELQKKITHLETELEEVKEKVKELKNSIDDGSVSKPQDGQEYWFISGSGQVYRERWSNDIMDHEYYSIGNCFPTKKSAEATVRVRKLIQKAKESQDGFVPDWEDSTQHKYTLHFENNGIWVGSNFLRNLTPTLGYWGYKSVCEEFIDENHKELLWFFTEYRR